MAERSAGGSPVISWLFLFGWAGPHRGTTPAVPADEACGGAGAGLQQQSALCASHFSAASQCLPH